MKAPIFALACLLACVAAPRAWSHTRHHHRPISSHSAPVSAPLDLSPVTVLPYAVSGPENVKRAKFQAKMHQEAGLDVPATHWITNDQVMSRSLFILQITQSLEGGFDSVNLHDRGIVSWGIMQWAAHSGSLGGALTYIKRRLLAQHEQTLWNKLFVANGLDADGSGLIVYGRPVLTAADARLAFRGSLKPGNANPKLLMHWAKTFGRAGRQPRIEALEVEYAGRIVDAILQKRLPNLPYHAPGRSGLTVDDLAASDPYAEALVFALWTNNPRNAFTYVADAARSARTLAAGDDPASWPAGAFGDALMHHCQTSTFGNWPQRAALIASRQELVRTAAPDTLTPFERDYQLVLTARKLQRQYEVASRHLQEQRRSAGRESEKSNTLTRSSRCLQTLPERKPKEDDAKITNPAVSLPHSTSDSSEPVAAIGV